MATMLEQHNAIVQFINKTDFAELKEQKKALINAMSALNVTGFGHEETIEHLEGLLNFIDSFQDIAVDFFGKHHNEVFDFTVDLMKKGELKTFNTIDRGAKSPVLQYDGEQVEIVRVITEVEPGYDLEVLPMYEVKVISTGAKISVYPEELSDIKS